MCSRQQNCKICEAELIEPKEEIGRFTIINGDFTPLSTTERSRQKISKYIEGLNTTNNQQDLINIYIKHSTQLYHNIFSVSKEHIPRQTMYEPLKETSARFKVLKSYNVFSNYSRIKLEIINRNNAKISKHLEKLHAT